MEEGDEDGRVGDAAPVRQAQGRLYERGTGTAREGGLLLGLCGCWGLQPPSSQPSPSRRPLRNPGLVARKPLVYSLGEGKIGGGDGGGVVGSGLGSDSGLSTLTLALSLPGRGNKTASPLRGRGVVQRSPQGRRRKIGRVGGLVAASVVRHAPPRDCGAAHHERLRVWFPSTSSGQALRASEGLRTGSPRTVSRVATGGEEEVEIPRGTSE